MTKPIKIVVRGTLGLETDAPTVDDLVSQLRDMVEVLVSVDQAISQSGNPEIEWRVTNATRNSPISIEVTPFPRKHGMNIDRRTADVLTHTRNGLAQLEVSGQRPLYFSDAVLNRVEKICSRVTNGLAETILDASDYGQSEIVFSRSSAPAVTKNLARVQLPHPVSYRELGSVEGYITRVELDGFKRPVVHIRTRLDGASVKCIAKGKGLDRVGHLAVAQVLSGLRIQAFGTLWFRDVGNLYQVDVDTVTVYQPDERLPPIESVISPGFTAGVEASEYLRNLREDG